MSKLPLEVLKEKYIPIEDFPSKYGIRVITVERLIQEKKIRYAEFKVSGSIRRTPHANPEDVIEALKKEGVVIGGSHSSI